MNFQLHLSHGVQLFALYSLVAALLGHALIRLIGTAHSPDERMGNAVFGLIMLGLSAAIVLVGIVMAFLCQYAAYAFVAAVFTLSMSLTALTRS